MTTLGFGFWRNRQLEDLSDDEWESLCDGCGKCCLNKLQDEDSGEVYYTRVACNLLDSKTGKCSDYSNRQKRVPDCLNIRDMTAEQRHWLPATCAYRLLGEGEDLPTWHHLITGRRSLVHKATCTVRNRVISETDVDPDTLEDHIIRWIDR